MRRNAKIATLPCNSAISGPPSLPPPSEQLTAARVMESNPVQSRIFPDQRPTPTAREAALTNLRWWTIPGSRRFLSCPSWSPPSSPAGCAESEDSRYAPQGSDRRTTAGVVDPELARQRFQARGKPDQCKECNGPGAAGKKVTKKSLSPASRIQSSLRPNTAFQISRAGMGDATHSPCSMSAGRN